MRQERSREQDFRVCVIYLIARKIDDAVVYVGASLNLKSRKTGTYVAFAGRYRTEELRWVAIEMCVAAEQEERERFWLEVMRMLRQPITNTATPRRIHTNAIDNRKIWRKE